MWKCDHISSQIWDLDWLKVKEQITFKIAAFMFLCIRDQAPVYLRSLLPHIKTSHRTLRSSTSKQVDRAYFKNSQAKAGALYWSQHMEQSASHQKNREETTHMFKCKPKPTCLIYCTAYDYNQFTLICITLACCKALLKWLQLGISAIEAYLDLYNLQNGYLCTSQQHYIPSLMRLCKASLHFPSKFIIISHLIK